MDSADREVLEAACSWLTAGRGVTLATVVRTFGSSPRPPGAWLALRGDGALVGSVSGGCIEEDLVLGLRDGRLDRNRPFLLRYGVTREEAARFGLPCGGTLELLVEPAPDRGLLTELLRRISAGELARRVVDLEGGAGLEPGLPGDQLSFDGHRLSVPLGPRRRLLIIGAGQISRFLAEMALALDYAVTVCDPREEYTAQWAVAEAARTSLMPDDAVVDMQPDAASAIVALTHDPKLDDMALLEALKSPAFYVGALGSQASQAKRRERLRLYFDLGEAELARLRGPVGLAIGSRTPAEIAVSVLAEMTAVKNGVAAPAPAEAAP